MLIGCSNRGVACTQALNKAILRLLESYFEMPKVVAVKVLTMYKQYLEHTQRVGRVFEDARALLGYDKVC